MKPIKLSIEGVFSYREKQIIDFEKLSKGDIFGIFGKTGSGKSSIIEAIIFALYQRLDKITGRQVDLINLQSERAIIEFEFESFGKRYLATSILKRRSSGHVNDSKFYIKEEGEWRALNKEITAENIIGLSYENFCRIVIIPQGKFQEFFSLTDKERTTMLKQIFPLLNDYDLMDSLKSIKNQTETQINIEDGQLRQLETYSKEGLEEREQNLESIKQKYSEQEYKHKKLEEQLKNTKQLFDDFKRYHEVCSQKESIAKEEDKIGNLKKELNEYEIALNKFQLPLANFTKAESDIKTEESKQSYYQTQLKETKTKFEIAEKALEVLKQESEKTDEAMQEIEKIDALLDLRKIELQQSKKETELSKAIGNKQKGEILTAEKEKEKSFLETEIKNKENRRLNLEEFNGFKNWFVQKENLNSSMQRLRGEIEDLSKQKQDTLRVIDILVDSDYESILKDMFSSLENSILEAENKRSNYLIEKALCEYSKDLTENKPCPLCGSLSHPSPANLTNVDSHLKQINEELKTLNSKKDLLKSGMLSLDSLNKQIISKKKNVETLFSDIESHSNKFVWEKYRDLSSEQIREIEQNEALLQREIAKLRDNESKVSKEYSSYLKRLTELENEINNIKTELAKYEGMSKPLTEKIDPYFKEKHSNNDTESLIKIRAQRNEEIEKRNQETEKRNKELNFLNQELVRLETILGNCEENLKRWKQEFEKYNNVLREAIAESEFENLAQVQAILNKNLNIATIRERIEQFSQQKTNLENSYNELLNKISDKEEPSIETINADKATLKESNDLLKSLLESKGKIEGEIKEFKDKLSEKQAVQERFDKLNIRLEGIKELDKMLKGDKFVQFISSIYLEQLCSKANERLRIISQNKFEIRNSEKNFEIIDYLNGAKSRSIKTLSGGQMFQASLCMALALVDTIRLNSNSNQEFFFIDEGFGTQDNECLDLIFESLKLLRQENKTVGLISHNENLKEKISGSITIELQQNKGSIIRTNYP